jgi:hypothetical protein
MKTQSGMLGGTTILSPNTSGPMSRGSRSANSAGVIRPLSTKPIANRTMTDAMKQLSDQLNNERLAEVEEVKQAVIDVF